MHLTAIDKIIRLCNKLPWLSYGSLVHPSYCTVFNNKCVPLYIISFSKVKKGIF